MKTAIQHTHWQLAPTDAATIQGEDDLHQCILNILSTRKGSDIITGEAPEFHFSVRWCIAEDVARQIYATEYQL